MNVLEHRGRFHRAEDYNESPHRFVLRERGRSRDVDRSQHQRFDAPTLEGRIKPLYGRRYDDSFYSVEPFSASPSRGRAPEPGSRVTRIDDRDHYNSYDERNSRWDRSNFERPFPPSPYLGGLTPRPSDFDRSSSLFRNGLDYDKYENRMSKEDSPPPTPRRGGSLLDRLSLGMSGESEVVATSFRDIGDVIDRRDADQAGRTGGDTPTIGKEYGGNREQDITSKASRARRRGGKTRRPRKGGQ